MPLCPKCQENGCESETFEGTTCSTSENPKYIFYDDGGRLHQHDPNLSETAYCCSNGHDWREHNYIPCPVCGDEWRRCPDDGT